MRTTLAVLAMMSLAATAGAQVVVSGRQTTADEKKIQVMQEVTKTSRVRLSVEAKPVVGAPYSGEAVTEAVQVLADGNRIVRRTTSRIYRDGKGRTRRETLGQDGQVTSIVITDPTGLKSYVIDPDTNIASSNSVFTIVSSKVASAGGGGRGTVDFFATSGEPNDAAKAKLATELKMKKAAVAGEAGNDADKAKLAAMELTAKRAVAAGEGQFNWASGVAGDPKSASKEDLGQQTIEGVLANGTRTTTVIAAGVIGNELPISVVSEEWFSPDLKVLVMTRHADPRTGETTYRLTGINRSEPNPSLFELPAGITVK